MLHKLTVSSTNNTFNVDRIPYLSSSISPIVSEAPVELLTELESTEFFRNLAKTFLDHLQRAVQRRVTNLPSLCRECKRSCETFLRPSTGCQHAKLAILFSGGIDSTVIAALTDRILPSNEPVDLLNVAFFTDVPSPTADRQTGK